MSAKDAPAPVVPRDLSAVYLANEEATPVTVDATFVPGVNAKVRDAKSAPNATKSVVSASVQPSLPISARDEAFLGF